MNVQAVCHAFRALEYRRENRKRFETAYDCEVEVEIYPGLRLDGWFEGIVQYSDIDSRFEYLADPEILLTDKNEKEVRIDWDDLSEKAQDWITQQVRNAFNGD